MEGKEFAGIRKELGLTQAELASVLAMSTRAVQNYEQGWRRIVPAAERNILLLLMFSRQLKNKKNTDSCCWKEKNCKESKRKNCIAAKLKLPNLCWYITGTLCSSEEMTDWEEKIKKCRQCQVFQNLFEEPAKVVTIPAKAKKTKKTKNKTH